MGRAGCRVSSFPTQGTCWHCLNNFPLLFALLHLDVPVLPLVIAGLYQLNVNHNSLAHGSGFPLVCGFPQRRFSHHFVTGEWQGAAHHMASP